jgi:hypothetical protein
MQVNQLQTEAFRMPPPANGIAPDVIRDVTPPSHLGGDLLDGTFRALPRPPTPSWRQVRTRRC